MHYLIDGYNLLFRVVGQPCSLRQERERLIEILDTFAENLNLDITIVFDSAFYEGESSRSHFHSLEIVFTSLGETADEYIIDFLHFVKASRNEIIVTSDKSLARISRSLGASTLSIEKFMMKLRSQKNVSNSEKKQKREFKKQKQPLKKDHFLSPISKGASSFDLLEYYLEVFEKKLQDEEDSKREP